MTEAEDKERAEKLAAAKKRFEQLKKQKGKKGGAKKKEDRAEADPESSKSQDTQPESQAGADGAGSPEPARATPPGEADRAPHARKTSVSRVQTEMAQRLASQPLSPGPASLRSPLSPGSESIHEIYKKQVVQIEELVRENKQLREQTRDLQSRCQKAEEELDELREASSEVAELKSRADQASSKTEEAERLKTELAALQRQNTQLQTQASKHSRRISSATPPSAGDLSSQLTSKANTIESLELEISNLHNQLSRATAANAEQAGRIDGLENSLARAEQAASASAHELSELKQNLERASERAVKEGSSRSSAETRVAQLEAELSATRKAAEDAAKRAETLEKKVETLTTLHRESDTRSQTRLREADKVEREAKELRSRVTFLTSDNARLLREAQERHRRVDVAGADDGIDELEGEERAKLEARIRELEDEVFELRRGVWRDRRRELQPDLESPTDLAHGFDDVDLSGGHSPRAQRGSSFQDVINSGISAFTGQRRRGSSAAAKHQRQQSLGLLSEDGSDFVFDEEAFRLAQEEEAKKRVERIREVKRSLPQFKGWRVDLVDLRMGYGGVFDI